MSTPYLIIMRPGVFLWRSIVDTLGSVLHAVSAHRMHLVAFSVCLTPPKYPYGVYTLSHFTFRRRQIWQL
jgi:hypothetical protein